MTFKAHHLTNDATGRKRLRHVPGNRLAAADASGGVPCCCAAVAAPPKWPCCWSTNWGQTWSCTNDLTAEECAAYPYGISKAGYTHCSQVTCDGSFRNCDACDAMMPPSIAVSVSPTFDAASFTAPHVFPWWGRSDCMNALAEELLGWLQAIVGAPLLLTRVNPNTGYNCFYAGLRSEVHVSGIGCEPICPDLANCHGDPPNCFIGSYCNVNVSFSVGATFSYCGLGVTWSVNYSSSPYPSLFPDMGGGGFEGNTSGCGSETPISCEGESWDMLPTAFNEAPLVDGTIEVFL